MRAPTLSFCRQEPTENHVYLALVSVLALLLLFMEIRRPHVMGLKLHEESSLRNKRILHCPASCTFEEAQRRETTC